mmetsp:Transcript_32371/g.81797  ORF Transcript_32371/g.81797 Transcript_32371/m.81797 type:complete len:202 (-) Transcript_32371:1377-1982(-)
MAPPTTGGCRGQRPPPPAGASAVVLPRRRLRGGSHGGGPPWRPLSSRCAPPRRVSAAPPPPSPAGAVLRPPAPPATRAPPSPAASFRGWPSAWLGTFAPQLSSAPPRPLRPPPQPALAHGRVGPSRRTNPQSASARLHSASFVFPPSASPFPPAPLPAATLVPCLRPPVAPFGRTTLKAFRCGPPVSRPGRPPTCSADARA